MSSDAALLAVDAGERPASHDLARVLGEMFQRREAAGLRVQIGEVKRSPAQLRAAVLACQTAAGA